MEWIAFINHFKQLYQLQFKQLSNKYHLNMIEINILLFLKNNPTLNTAKDIVNFRGLAKSNVSTAIEQLRKRELLTLKVDSNNRRIQRIILLDHSQAMLNELRSKQLSFFNDLHKGFSKEESALLELFKERLHQNIINMMNVAEKE